MSSNKNLFSFRLPNQYMQWFEDHIPEGQGNDKHKAMLALVIQTIESQNDFYLTHESPEDRLANRIMNEVQNMLDTRDDNLREYIRQLVRGNGAGIQALQTARETFQQSGGDDVPDDLIDNILEGL